MPSTEFPALLNASDRGIMVLFGDTLDDAVNQAAHAFDAAIHEQQWPEVSETIPAIRSVLVCFDPLQISTDGMQNRIIQLLESRDWYQAGSIKGRRRWRLPAYYGDDAGPDLPNVADQLGISIGEAIRQHSETTLRVLMLGFAPGCAYLGSLPENWDLPRLDYVKPDMPPGSLSVAVRQTVLFATAIPTGWQTIGRTPFLSFSKHIEPWFFLAPGDEIRFEPIDQYQFDVLSAEVAQGKMIVTPECLV